MVASSCTDHGSEDRRRRDDGRECGRNGMARRLFREEEVLSVKAATVQRAEKRIGLREAVCLGIGGVIGAGIFVLSGPASGTAGPAVVVSFAIAFVASMLLGFCYAELASLFPEAGGPYAFCRSVFRPLVAGMVGWAYWGAWVSASGYVALGFGSYLQVFLPGLPQLAGATCLIIVFVLVNLLGIHVSGRVQIGILVLEVAALVTFIGVGIAHIDSDLYTPFAPHGFTGIFAAALIGFLALTGWDVIVVASEEMRHPRRNVPLAIFISLAVVLVLYVGLLFVANGVISSATLGDSPAPIRDASAVFLGSRGPQILSAIVLVALTATANSFIIVISRTAFALARDGMAPRALALTWPANGVPWAAVVCAGGAQWLVTALGSVQFSTSATGFLYLLTFMASVMALVVARRRGLRGQFRVPFYPVTALIALAICCGMILKAGVSGMIAGSIWLGFAGAVLTGPYRSTAGWKSRSEGLGTPTGDLVSPGGRGDQPGLDPARPPDGLIMPTAEGSAGNEDGA